MKAPAGRRLPAGCRSIDRLCKLALVATLVTGSGWLLCMVLLPECVRVPARQMELPPSYPHAIRQAHPAEASIRGNARLLQLACETRAACGSIEAAKIVCHGLRSLMGSEPSFEGGEPGPIREAPLSPEAVFARWARHEPVDSLSVACLAVQLLVESGLDCRLVKFGEGRTPWARAWAGLELWHESQRAWFLVDPSMGLTFNRSTGFLAASELRDARRSGKRFDVTPLVHPMPVTPLGRHEVVYTDRIHELYVALPPRDGEAARGRPDWGLVERPGGSELDSVARRELSDATAVLVSVYLLLLLLGQVQLLPVRGDSAARRRPLDGSQAFTVSFVAADCLSLLRSMAGAFGGHVSWTISGVRRLLKPVHRGFDRASSGARGLWTSLAAALGKALAAVDALGRGIGQHLASRGAVVVAVAARVAAELWRSAGAYRERLGAGKEVPRRPRPLVFVATLLLGCALLGLQIAVSDSLLEEDAFIGFRFARNLATGHGLRFNAEEPPVEGFSNTLWLLLLAAGFKAWPDMAQVSLALAFMFGVLQLALVGWMACRAGAGAWLPVLLLATNISFARSITTGLETPLCSFLTLLAACLWVAESPHPSPGRLAMTAGVCWLLTLARADGWFLFLGLSCIRVLSGGARTVARSLSYWWWPYLSLTLLYLAVRWSYFGSVVPYIYYGRLLNQRGELLARLLPGLQYVAAALFWNLPFLIGLAGLERIARSRSAIRMSLVVTIQFTLVALVGGDAGYICFYRFVMPVAGLIALLAQQAYLRLATTGRTRVVAGATLALVLAGNLQVLPGPDDHCTLEFNPLLVSARQGVAGFELSLQRFADRLSLGDGHYANYSFDGEVSTHLSGSVDTRGELACDQAGRMAYFWTGPFFDLGGLVMPGPSRGPFLLDAHHRPRWYLLVYEQLCAHWQTLASSGYRIERVYASASGGLDYLRYCLLIRSDRQGVRMTPSLFGRVDFRWWLLPEERIVLLLEGERPVIDGPGHFVDDERTRHLAPPYVAWFARADRLRSRR